MKKNKTALRILSSLLTLIMVTGFQAMPVLSHQAYETQEPVLLETEEAYEAVEEEDGTISDGGQSENTEIIIDEEPENTAADTEYDSSETEAEPGAAGSVEDAGEGESAGSAEYAEEAGEGSSLEDIEVTLPPEPEGETEYVGTDGFSGENGDPVGPEETVPSSVEAGGEDDTTEGPGGDDPDGGEETSDDPNSEFPSGEAGSEEIELPAGEAGLTEEGDTGSEEFVIEDGLLISYRGEAEEVFIPEGVTGIGDSAFYQCAALKSVSIPEGVTGIGDSAFCQCAALKSVVIPESVTSIGNSAFCQCESLESVTIPEGVVSIGDYAFKDCAALESATFLGDAAALGEAVFDGCSLVTLYCFSDAAGILDYAKQFSLPYSINIRVPVSGITINSAAVSVFAGKTKTLTAEVTPGEADIRDVKWTTSNAGVATVTSSGVVKGTAKGTATITASAQDGSGVKAVSKVTVIQPVTKLTMSKTAATIKKGASLTLSAAAAPANANNKAVTWTTSNAKVATVTSAGAVKGIAKGTVTITATAKDGSGKKATCKVTVTQPVTKLTMSRTAATIKKGAALTLKATAAPANANNKAVTWTTSNKKVATVTSAGAVKGIAKGTVTITATAKDGSGKKATCKVTVTQPVTKLTMSRTTASVKTGRTVALKATAAPANANNKAVTWTTSNKKVATVTSAGVVRGVAKGTVTITATAKDGSGKKAACKVTVIKQTYPERDTIKVNGVKLTKGQYANFRNVCAGKMAPDVLYRCINPILPYSSKQKQPAYYADRLLEAHDVLTVINLSDSLSKMKSKGYSKATYYKKLLKKGTVYSRKLQDNGKYDSVSKKKQIADVVRVIVQHNGPYVIHCKWGQGRTGMVIMLLESLMGANYNYIYNDFVTTFKNFNKVGKHTSSSDYNREFSKYMRSITGKKAANTKKPKAQDWSKVNLEACARKYLKAGGMTDAEINTLKKRLSKR